MLMKQLTDQEKVADKVLRYTAVPEMTISQLKE